MYRIVFDDQHGFALPGPGRIARLRRRLQKRPDPMVPGQIEFHAGTLSHLAVDLNMPAGLLHKAVDLGEAQSGALTRSFRRKKGLECFLDDILGHARAGVGYEEDDILAGG